MAGYLVTDKKKVTACRFQEMKSKGEKISMLTAYDYTTAGILDEAGVDSILIGDSASNVMAGKENTIPITMEQMIYHARSAAGGQKTSGEEGIHTAIGLMKESGVDAVKLEGGIEIIDTVKGIIDAGVPVCGHLGLTPQSINKFGGYGLRAKDEAEARKLMSDAQALTDAGCFAVVLEKVPAQLAAEVTHRISSVTIGIGAGNATDGQVLVYADMMGMTRGFKPKFLRQYANLAEIMTDAVGHYVTDVKSGDFPSAEESY